MIHLYIIWKNLKFKNFYHLFLNFIDYTNFLLAVIHKPSYFPRWFSISFILILIRSMAIIEMLSHSIFIKNDLARSYFLRVTFSFEINFSQVSYFDNWQIIYNELFKLFTKKKISNLIYKKIDFHHHFQSVSYWF